ncbi:MAG: 50S ribosomal protein L23 [Pseudomonadota bacterium]|nr:50S ribosomal protein L23 [Pseudomonadota bacterium]
MTKEILLKTIQSHHLTEETYQMPCDNIYTFKVVNNASKNQIKQAVETIFGVKVENVNTMNYKPEIKRNSRGTSTTKRFKKAMVKLAEGSSIDPNSKLAEAK